MPLSLGAYLGEEALENGVDAMVSSWHRAAPNTIPTAAKAGGNYLSSLLVGGEARRHGYAEGIALSVDGYLSEGAGETFRGEKRRDPDPTDHQLYPAGYHP